MSTRYLPIEQIIAIHDDQIRRFGDHEAYPTLELKAAVLCHSLLKNHPFRDGNKRTAMISIGVFLRLNGYRLRTTSDQLVALALNVEQDVLNEKEISLWIAERMVPAQ